MHFSLTKDISNILDYNYYKIEIDRENISVNSIFKELKKKYRDKRWNILH